MQQSRRHSDPTPAAYCDYYQSDSKNQAEFPITKLKISTEPEKCRDFSRDEYFL